tara:strand:- start:37 stop:219 length:183 start_codon:yes stop_codon:yes gene_type:complete
MSLEKVKELLSSGDYDTIDEGIQVAIDLNDSKIFDDLLDGCSDLSTSLSYGESYLNEEFM